MPAMPPVEIPLNTSVSDTSEKSEERSPDSSRHDRALTNVTASTLTVSWPKNFHPGQTLPTVLVCPGGGYAKVVIDKEGHDLARWLNENGYIAAVLKYRLPRADEQAERPRPIEDGLEAVRTLRERAVEWGIQRTAVGILGCSAGGHLASTVSTRSAAAGASPLTRPDFQILLYPVITLVDGPTLHAGSRRNLLGEPPDPRKVVLYSNDGQVTADTPPAFLVHAADDGSVPIENSRLYLAALQKAGVPCQFVDLETGEHGFGLGIYGGEPLKWPPLCLEWLKQHVKTGP